MDTFNSFSAILTCPDPDHHVVRAKDSRSTTVGVFATRDYLKYEAISVYCGRYYTCE